MAVAEDCVGRWPDDLLAPRIAPPARPIVRAGHVTETGDVCNHLDEKHQPYAVDRRARQSCTDSVGVVARQTADLAELKDWVEGLRAAAHTARQEGNITLAKALDITRSRYTSPTLTRSTPTAEPSGC